MDNNRIKEIIRNMILNKSWDVNKVDVNGTSILMYCIKQQFIGHSYIKLIRLLLENGADPNMKSYIDFSLDTIGMLRPLYLATIFISPKIASILLKYGAVVNNNCNDELSESIFTRFVGIYCSLCNESIDAVPKKYKYLQGWYETIQIALAQKPNLNPNNGNTALSHACNALNKNMITLLLMNGANPNHYTKQQIQSYISLIVRRNTDVEYSIELLNILEEHGMVYNNATELKGHGFHTPVIISCIYRRYRSVYELKDFMQFLINRGVDINEVSLVHYSGFDVIVGLFLTKVYNITETCMLLNFLIDKGADFNIMNMNDSILIRTIQSAKKILRFDELSISLLHDIICILVELGIDINIRNKKGKNALDILLGLPIPYENGEDFMKIIELLINKEIQLSVFDKYIHKILKPDIGFIDPVHENSEAAFYEKICRIIIRSGAIFNRINLMRTIEKYLTQPNINKKLCEAILGLLNKIQPVVSLRRLCLNALPRSVPGIPKAFFQYPDDIFYPHIQN